MFRKAKSEQEARNSLEFNKPDNESTATLAPVLRYPKPKVLLVDLKDDSEGVLKSAGYNVMAGTFGSPYEIAERSDTYQIVREQVKIPNYAEQEVLVIDLAPGEIKEVVDVAKAIAGDSYYWAKCNRGVIDPRPASMARFCNAFDRILSHGGIFIVFADDPVTAEIIWAKKTNRYIEPSEGTYGLWSFLSILDESIFAVGFVHGSEMVSELDQSKPFGRLLSRYLSGATYTCSLEPKETGFKRYHGHFHNDHFKSWMTLAKNKFGAAVAGAFLPHGKTKGVVLILPQLPDKSRFLVELFRDVLPVWVPDLFPYAEPGHWKNKDDYQLPSILTMKYEIERIKSESSTRIAEIESNIESLRSETSYMIDLLTETGDNLVKAVKRSLEVCGFESVLDMDEELKQAAVAQIKREDLRIEHEETLLVEVKGIANLPTDADALQVQKYVMVRMREWDRTNVQGLEIINHQKAVPPLDREHDAPFRQDILVNAEDQQFGLMTTWDLYRLVRSFLANGWKRENVMPLFFKFGRIVPVPLNYEQIGVVEHYWEKASAVSVDIQSGQIDVGDRIAFELPTNFEEQDVDSLQLEGLAVQSAKVGSIVGIRTSLTKSQLKSGVCVYRVVG